MSQDLYRTLQKQLDTYSLGFPSTESGVEIELLRELFSEDDANVFAKHLLRNGKGEMTFRGDFGDAIQTQRSQCGTYEHAGRPCP